jgi:hypothetical protein
VILDETLDRIKAEVFASTAGQQRPTNAADGPSPGTGKKAGSGADSGREWRGETPPDTGQGAGGGPDTGKRADAGREWRGDTPPGAGSTDTN